MQLTNTPSGYWGFGKYLGGGSNNNVMQSPIVASPYPFNPLTNPFSSASSGGVSGTLQPYVNRMTQNANNALYGGLLNYQPQSIVAGNAGGTPVNSTPPQFNIAPSLLNANFGNRSWMGK